MTESWISLIRWKPSTATKDTAVPQLNLSKTLLGLRLDIAAKPSQGFQVLPKRRIIERPLAWLGGFRRLAKDFEILTNSAENMIRIAIIKITVAKCV